MLPAYALRHTDLGISPKTASEPTIEPIAAAAQRSATGALQERQRSATEASQPRTVDRGPRTEVGRTFGSASRVEEFLEAVFRARPYVDLLHHAYADLVA